MRALLAFAGVFAVFLMVTGCGVDRGAPPAAVESAMEPAAGVAPEGTAMERSPVASGDIPDPCELVRTLREPLGLAPGDARIAAVAAAHPSCQASWERSDAEEVQRQAAAVMPQYMKRRIEAERRGEPFDEPIPLFRTENHVTLTIFAERFENGDEGVEALEEMVKIMTEGVMAEAQGRPIEMESDFDWVEGVGERAAWSGVLSQLSVVDDGLLFHLAVKTSDVAGENRARAVELAGVVVETVRRREGRADGPEEETE